MELISDQNTIKIIFNTLNRVDSRLVDHGQRVAYIAYHILKQEPDLLSIDDTTLLLLCILHDIGAYKTEEINQLVQFETQDVWNHSIYGAMFLKQLSPLGKYADAILYHHTPYQEMVKDQQISSEHAKLANLIFFADRIDILCLLGCDIPKEIFSFDEGMIYEPFKQAFETINFNNKLINKLKKKNYQKELNILYSQTAFSLEQKIGYLSLMAYSIDFRSQFMVLHTITTACYSYGIANVLNLSNEQKKIVFLGALLHDLGKVAIPIQILDKPGKLSEDEMSIMQTHVSITGEIIKELLDQRIYDIAIHHHERMNGSGYPDGIMSCELSLEERIVAVADVISALIRKRSYKDAFDLTKVIAILTQQKEDNLLCSFVVDTVIHYFEILIQINEQYSNKMLLIYENLKIEYEEIRKQVSLGLLPHIQCSNNIPFLFNELNF